MKFKNAIWSLCWCNFVVCFFLGLVRVLPYRPRKTKMPGCRFTTMIWAKARRTMMQSCGFAHRYVRFFGSSMCNRCCCPPLFPSCTSPLSHLVLLELLSRTFAFSASSATFLLFFCSWNLKMSMVELCPRSIVFRCGRAAILLRNGHDRFRFKQASF